MPLTDLAIRKAKPGLKTLRLFDRAGLYLEIAPSGGKWWRMKYRFAGKEKRLSLGTFPTIGLKEARERLDGARRLLSDGRDPGDERQAAKAAALERSKTAPTVEEVARAWLAHRCPAWKARTKAMIEASLENHVFPALGKRPIAEIQPREIRQVVQVVESTGATETAGRVFQRLRAVYRYAVAHDLAATDPTYPLKPAEIFAPRPVRHRAALAEIEMPAFLMALAGYEGDEKTKLALELLVLTATRPGELRGMQWDEIDVNAALWRIPAARMKMKTEHLVPLSKQAVALLSNAAPSSSRNGHVFASPFYPGKPISDGTLNSALARLGYKGRTTAHGFRTVFSTCANENGWNPDIIERQLAHEERNEVRAAYNRAQWLDERRRLMQWWGDRVDSMRAQSGSHVASKRRSERVNPFRVLEATPERT